MSTRPSFFIARMILHGINARACETLHSSAALRFLIHIIHKLSARAGRIYKAVSHAPRAAPWFWGLDFHEWQGSDGPQYGNVASLEATKQVFRAAWDRRPKASGKS